MIFWIIIGLVIVYSAGFITSALLSSSKVADLYNIVDYLKAQIKEYENKLNDMEKKIGSYPTYDEKI